MRYHAHIIKVANEQPLVSAQLAMFFENNAFLTYDLPVMSTETMNYSRRCVESCDFVIMIIGDSYGQTNISGVSQMHLSYLTARAKRKPMLIFINTNNTGTWERQRQDFVSLVEEQNHNKITYYQYEQVFAQYLKNAYNNFYSNIEEANPLHKNYISVNNGMSEVAAQSDKSLQDNNRKSGEQTRYQVYPTQRPLYKLSLIHI